MDPTSLRPARVDDGGFESMRCAFDEAASGSAGERRQIFLSFAGRPLLLDVAGGRLFEKIRATFSHLAWRDAAVRPRLCMRIWDGAETGVAAPADSGRHDLAWGGNDWSMTSSGGHRFLREARPGRVAALDRGTGELVVCYASADSVTLQEQGRPVARLISQMYRSLGLQRVHAALVSWRGTGVLIVGGGGCGKTTIALDCVSAGLDYLSDDVVAVEQMEGGRHFGYSMYGSANALPFHLVRHPVLASHARRDASQDKALLFPASIFPERVIAATRIAAILLPRVTGGELTRIVPMRRREMLPLLAPSSPEHVHAGFTDRDQASLAALVRDAACSAIEPGADPAEVAAAVRSHLAPNEPG